MSCRKVQLGFLAIYWRFIDEKYFGRFTSIDERLKLLSVEGQRELDTLVQLKLHEAKERKLDKNRTLDEILAS